MNELSQIREKHYVGAVHRLIRPTYRCNERLLRSLATVSLFHKIDVTDSRR